jgi:hypothetical protein
MSRLQIAARIYAVLIQRSPREFTAANDGAAQREALDALTNSALVLADALISAHARTALSEGDARTYNDVPPLAH